VAVSGFSENGLIVFVVLLMGALAPE